MIHSSVLRALRVAALTLLALAAFPAAGAVAWNRVYSGFAQPVDVVGARDGSGRLFIAQQTGVVRVVKNGAVLPTPFLDLTGLTTSSGEQGLLGLVFHPQFATNRQFFVDYTRASDGATVIARYLASAANPDVADPTSATILLVIAQPYSNHNGGALRFGPDGYFYIGMGDGGSGNDPEMRAQDKTTLLGKILRIDVNNGNPYAIPPGNPFANGVGGRPEIFAIGLRNPWRFSFDRSTGDFWIGDVGQGAVEEIDLLPAGTGAGANLGWRVVEGNVCTGLSGPVACNDPTLTAPVLAYTHAVGCSVTGGYRYRGAAVPSLAGQYVYGDFCSGRIWAAQRSGSGPWVATELADTAFGISTFGEDDAGELYFADYNTGDIYKFAESGPPPTSPVLNVSAPSLDFGTVAVGGTSAAQTLQVTNTGGGSLTLAAISVASTNPRSAEFVRSGTCAAGSSLTATQTCTITLQFRPSTSGARASTLTITSNGGNANVALQGVGGTGTPPPPPPPPVFSLSGTSLIFGSVNLGATSPTQSVSVSNAGGGTLTLSALTPGGANAGDFARSGTCAAATGLAAGQSCTISYQFTPTASGARAATLAIGSNAGSGTLNLSGTGTVGSSSPTLAVSTSTLDFGTIALWATSPSQTITVSNAGTGTLTLGTLTAGGSQSGDFPRGGTCASGTALPPGQSCTIVVRFAPTVSGARTATLAVPSNGGSATLTFTGIGRSPRG